jgi:hypothetical protein
MGNPDAEFQKCAGCHAERLCLPDGEDWLCITGKNRCWSKRETRSKR